MKRSAVFVGINSYQLPIMALRFSRNNAQLLWKTFSSQYDEADLLVDEEAGADLIIDAIQKKVATLSAGDFFVFYFSGNVCGVNGEPLMMGTKAKDNLLRHRQGVLSMDTVRELTEKKGLRRLFILDCDRDDYLTGNGEGWERTSTGNLCFDSVIAPSSDPEIIPPVVISACDRGESSWEDPVHKCGYFAEVFADVLRNSERVVHFPSFFNTLKSEMENQGIPGNQKPVLYGNAETDLPLWTVENKEKSKNETHILSTYTTADEALFAKVSACAVKVHRMTAKAMSGDSQIAFELGQMYENGQSGVPQDNKKAVSWYQKAAEYGNANAQCSLAFLYAGGIGVKRDDKAAVHWFLKAAEQGVAIAQYNLGFLYQSGRGVPLDNAESYKWFHKAAEQYSISAAKGDLEAQKILAWMYQTGCGLKKNCDESIRWYRLAAEQGHASAQFMLGWMYDEENGMIGNDEEAAKWYRKAAARGHAGASQNLMKVEQRLANKR